MGWQQYSRPLWLSRPNHYILYLNAITVQMRVGWLVFPQLCFWLAVVGASCSPCQAWPESSFLAHPGLTSWAIVGRPSGAGVRGGPRLAVLVALGRARRPSSKLNMLITLWLWIWLRGVWWPVRVSLEVASVRRLGPWPRKRPRKSGEARCVWRRPKTRPNSRRVRRDVRGRARRRREAVGLVAGL
jgi:hypothetical protein